MVLHMEMPQAIEKGKEKLRTQGEKLWQLGKAVLKGGIPTRFWILIFLVGVIAGAGLKTLAWNSITIGHDDYTLLPAARLYDLNQVERDALEKASVPPNQEDNTPPAESFIPNQ